MIRVFSLKTVSAGIVAMVMMLAVSCDRPEKELLDTIPADAAVVATVNADRILKRAGCQVKNGVLELTPELERLSGNASSSRYGECARMLMAVSGGIDMSQMVYARRAGLEVLTFRIVDDEAVENGMEAVGMKPVSDRGFDAVRLSQWTLAVDGTQGWLVRADEGDALERLKQMLASAGNDAVSASIPKMRTLTDDEEINIVVNTAGTDTLPVVHHGDFMCINIAIDDRVIGVDCVNMTADGTEIAMLGNLADVDAGFLRYMPENYVFAVAMGVMPDMDWSSLAEKLSAGMPVGQRAVLSMLVPYLCNIDGTVALAAAPAGAAPAIADINFTTWDVMLMAHMSREIAENIAETVVTSAEAMGCRTDWDEDVAEVTLPDGGELYAGYIDGYFVASNRKPESSLYDMFDAGFNGKQAAASLNIPYGSEVMKAFGLPYGCDIHAGVEGTKAKLRISLNGCSTGILQAVIAGMNRMEDLWDD